MKQKERDLKIQVYQDKELIVKLLNENNLILFNINGFSALLPKEFLNTLNNAIECEKQLAEQEKFNSYLALREDIDYLYLQEQFLESQKKEVK